MKIENYNDFKKFLDTLTYKPKLLLHACCAPCSSHCLFLLEKYFDITIFYSNDNIYREEEFDKRLDEIEKFTNKLPFKVNVISNGYNPMDYDNAILGLEELGEKSKRCYMCYKERLEKTAIKAKEEGYEYFSTTLSISPYKITRWINEIGRDLEEKYNIKYLYSDFKKESGYLHSIELSKEYGLYRQDYCGCKYSIKEMEEHKKIAS
jgi:predicted adenine nucleotide alpha hydrolase (AANH) superfamily ATPase